MGLKLAAEGMHPFSQNEKKKAKTQKIEKKGREGI